MGLIAVLVDNKVLDEQKSYNGTTLKEHVFAYAENVQKRIPYSQAFVVGIDPAEDTRKIATILEKMYYEGVDSNLLDNNDSNDSKNLIEDNKLIGVVLVGDVPIPVVKEEDGSFSPSIYPYTDFYRKKYIYDHNTGNFELNEGVSDPNPEVWHGVIVPPGKNEDQSHKELAQYFSKNNEYSNNPDYNNFEKRLMYANFPEMEKQMSKMDYYSYKHYLAYMEEMVFNRYNKYLLEHLITQVAGEIDPNTPASERTLPIPKSAMKNMPDWTTKNIFNQYTKPLAEAFRIYRGKINEKIEETGRWRGKEVDTPESLISIRDEFAKLTLKTRQMELEGETDKLIMEATKNERQELTGVSRMKVDLSLLGSDFNSRSFDFYAYIDGQRLAAKTSTGSYYQVMSGAKMCGIYLGQKREEGETVLENNSIYAEANRMYNYEKSIIIPDDDDDDLEDFWDYRRHAGCVSNNAIYNQDQKLGPQNCYPNQAVNPIFDLAGSKELLDDTPEYRGVVERCKERVNFYLEHDDYYKIDGAKGEIPGTISYGVSVAQVIKSAYEKMLKDERVDAINNPTLRQKTSEVIKSLNKDGQLEYSLMPQVKITLSTETFQVKLDTVISHVEPTKELLKAKGLSTPSIPSDGIRFVEFRKTGDNKEYDYLNLFRIQGDSPKEITENLLIEIGKKDKELGEATGLPDTKLASTFFKNNSPSVDWNEYKNNEAERIDQLSRKADLVEPIIWRALSADQKIKEVMPKYLDGSGNTVMPTLLPDDAVKSAPKVRPKGYEVLHIVANGDVHGYEFGLNKKLAEKALSKKEGIEKRVLAAGNSGDDKNNGDAKKKAADLEGKSICESPKEGVEIWDWPASLQCWIEEEILPAEELFTLNGACGVSPAPSVEEEEYKDPIDDDSQELDYFTNSMARKSLVIGESDKIYIYPMNSLGEEIVGYVPEKVHLELSNPSLGVFEKNDFNIYGGEGVVVFTANSAGSGTITITMGDAKPKTIEIDVYKSINIDLSNITKGKDVNTKKTYYKIDASLAKPLGGTIMNVDRNIKLSIEKRSAGTFENNGVMHIKTGDSTGTIKFWPSPMAKTVNVVANAPFYTQSNPVSIDVERKAVQLILDTPKSIYLDRVSKLKVIAADASGTIVDEFNGTVKVSIDDITSEYGKLVKEKVEIKNGKGVIEIRTKKETGVLKLKVVHPDLQEAVTTMDIVARIGADVWKNVDSQNLFASFVGFPAGDFTEEGYFAGTHLFNGKTQAVFAFVNNGSSKPDLIIEPTQKIIIGNTKYKIYPEFKGSNLSLEVMDQNKKLILFKEVSLNFNAAHLQKEGQKMESGKMYFSLSDENYTAEEKGGVINVYDRSEERVLVIKKNGIETSVDSQYSFIYNVGSDFEGIDLTLINGTKDIGSLKLNFKKEDLNKDDFEFAENFIIKKSLSGRSTNAPAGLALYNSSKKKTENTFPQYYGFEGKGNYIKLFASGMSIGDAVRFNLPSNAMLFGDPTVKLKTKSSSTLNYESSAGRKIFQDPKGEQILSLTHFNFNNDEHKDLALVMKSGRVRYLQGGATEPLYVDKGDISFLADGAIAIESFDFKKDGYEDLLVATKEGRLAIMHNDNEVITRENQAIKTGKQIYTLQKGDMDNDGYDDLVTLDSRGDIKIFYYDPQANRFPENGKLIGNYGFSLQLNKNLNHDLKIRYPGLDKSLGIEPKVASTTSKRLVEKAVESVFGSFTGRPTGEVSGEFKTLTSEELKAAQKKIENKKVELDQSGGSNNEPEKFPWAEKSSGQTETAFEDLNKYLFVSSTKTVKNKERPMEANIDLEEHLVYEIKIRSSKNQNGVVLADVIPDALSLDEKTVSCNGAGCAGMTVKKNDIYLFLSGINLRAGQEMTITYEVGVKHTPRAIIALDKLDDIGINDEYMDILVSPPYNTTGELIQHYSVAPKDYKVRATNNNTSGYDPNDKIMDLSTLEIDPNNPPHPSAILGDEVEKAMKELNDAEGEGEEDTNTALDKMIAGISNFSCMGGGCFPMPYNMAFLVPPKMAFPIFAFPTTLPTPVGPMPFIWPGSFLGASNIPGVHNSLIRLYLSPTLTGGMGVAMCWGLYSGSAVPPPPMAPIPYPPPIGNCMVMALPRSEMPDCKLMKEGMEFAVKKIRSAMGKMEKLATNVNNFGNQTGGADKSDAAGGLEISLAVKLGDSQKFTGPEKGFSNMHLAPMDSIGGVISDWMDRQTTEIMMKLMRFPTLYVALPDTSKVFSTDLDMLKTRWGIFTRSLGGGTRVGEEEDGGNPEGVVENLSYATKKTVSFLEQAESVARVNSNDLLKNLANVADSVPFVKIQEQYVDFRVPWVSPAEINKWILEANKWLIFHKRELNRFTSSLGCKGGTVKEYMATCVDLSNCGGGKKDIEGVQSCLRAKALSKFLVDFTQTIESVEENIEVLQSYLAFPKKFVLFKKQLIDYVRVASCYLEQIAQMFGGWMNELKEDMVAWAEMWHTIEAIKGRWEDLFKIFVDFDSSCSICTNERNANFGYWELLGLILPQIPIIQMPKIPDIMLDMSNLDGQIKIEVPMIQLNPQPVPLPPLPYLTLPSIPDISLAFAMPPIPILPRLPEFPDLPEMPAIPTIKLPTLPSPPKLPDIGKQIEVVIPLVEKVLEIWCLVKKSFTPVPESMLEDQVRLLTNRPMYIAPFELKPKIQAPAAFDLGFNQIKIETSIFLGFKVGNSLTEVLRKGSKEWQEWIDEIPKAMNEVYDAYMKKAEEWVQEPINQFDEDMNKLFEEMESDIQGELTDLEDSMRKKMKEADDEMREVETGMQKSVDKNITQKINNWAAEAKQEYANEIRDVNKEVQKKFEKWKTDGWMSDTLEFLESTNIDYEKEIDELFGDMSDDTKLLIFCLAGNKSCTITPFEEDKVSEKREAFVDPKESLQTLLVSLVDEVSKMSDAGLVDYKKVKKDLGVSDVQFEESESQADKIREMKNQLIAYAESMEKDVSLIKKTDTISMFAQESIRPIFPYELVSVEDKNESYELTRTITSAVDTLNLKEVVELQDAPLRQVKALSSDDKPVDQLGCSGVCLVDPVLNREVTVMPHPEHYTNYEMLLVPNKGGDKKYIVYNDGNSLFLKQDLTAPVYKSINTPKPVPNKIIQFDVEFMEKIGVQNLMEAPNMLQTTLAEDGNSTFSWAKSTNPNVYGYGIELERTVTSHNDGKQNDQLPDVKIILLPQNEDGSVPETYVDGKRLNSFNRLITSWEKGKEDEIRDHFGIDEKNITTGASEIVFNEAGGGMIKLKPHRAVYFGLYNKDSFSLKMKNGLYHIKMTWLDKKGNISTYNHVELLSPQTYASSGEPVVHPPKTFYVPVYKQKELRASEIATDLTGVYQHHWYDPTTGIPIASNADMLVIPPQKEPKEFMRKLVMTKDINDKSFKKYEVDVKIVVYVPEIELNTEGVQDGIIKGKLKPHPQSPEDDLSNIPFSVFRQRWGTWKNMGMLNKDKLEGAQTNPPLSDKEVFSGVIYKDNYYTSDKNGNYEIVNFNFSDPSPVELKNRESQVVARVHSGIGRIDILDEKYKTRVMPATVGLPTRILIENKAESELIGNVYYVADGNTDVEIKEESLSGDSIEDIGVTIGDNDPSDDFVAKNIPGFADSFPGGAAIYSQTPPQKNIAIIGTKGNIRLMQKGYSLKIKASGSKEDHYIFQIINSEEVPIFDIYIHANFENLKIQQGEIMNDEGIKIGFENRISPMIAALTPSDENPFVDLDTDHPYYDSILNLYKNRVISGYGDGSFKPNEKLTRAEFVKIALGVTNCFNCTNPTDSQREKYTPSSPFPDVNLPAWYYFCIWIAKELGMITGYGDGFFRPARNISRAEAVAVLLRQSSIEISEAPENAFLDVPDYAWYKDYVYTAVEIGLIPEKLGFVFPDEKITRGEFAFMGTGVMNVQDCHEVDTDGGGVPDWWEMENNSDPLDGSLEPLDDYLKDLAGEDDTPSKTCPCIDNPNQNDSDADGMIDACDNDIDNDGVLNNICIFDSKGDLDDALVSESDDNCIFDSNKNQDDLNKNKIGDVCEEVPVCPCLNNPNQNDSDADGMIDACDNDIDNDGKMNAICLFDDDGLVDREKLKDSEDNCIFIKNKDQVDSDFNIVGDVCEEEDMCPTVPEDLDGIDDGDGCPDIIDETPEHDPGINISKGPDCTFVDYQSDLVNGDIIMTVITDIDTHEMIYNKSNEATYISN